MTASIAAATRPSPAVTEPEDVIRDEVHRAVGQVGIVLIGSRATGTAVGDSDYDVVAVVRPSQLPRALVALPAVSRQLSAVVGTSVAVSPVLRSVLDGPARSMYAWKLRNESRQLAWPTGWPGATPAELPRNRLAAASYAMSAVLYLLEAAEPDALLAGRTLDPKQARLTEKAASHLQLLAELAGHDLAAARPPSGTTTALQWFSTRDGLLAFDPDVMLRRNLRSVALRNLEYAVASRLAGQTRWTTALGPSVERRLASAAVALLAGVGPAGLHVGLARARRVLPKALLPGTSDWSSARDVILREWPRAHILAAG